MRLPHPVLILLGAVALAAAVTWILPAGEFVRRDDPVSGRRVVLAGTYHRVDRTPVSAWQAVMAVPRGFASGIDVVMTVLLCGAAWVVVDGLGTLRLVIGALTRRLKHPVVAITAVSCFFAVMGAAENMQEEIVALVPVLLVLAGRLGVDAVTAVAMSAGAAIVGSAFGPTNPFQAGIALKLAELPALSGGGIRLLSFVAAVALWVFWTARYARAHPVPIQEADAVHRSLALRELAILSCLLLPLVLYIAGVMWLGWGFNELSAAFLLGGAAAGLIGGLGASGTTRAFLKGMQEMLPAASLIALARSISLVLEDGHVIDTILQGLAAPLVHLPAMATGVLMVPVQALIHIPVSSVSGQAALTIPIFAQLGDLVGLSRQVVVLAYQAGAGLMEMLTPTNGALMAVLLVANVPFQRWLRFAAGGTALLVLVGLAAMAAAA